MFWSQPKKLMQTQQSYYERDVAKNEIRRSADVAKSEARTIKDCKSVVNFWRVHSGPRGKSLTAILLVFPLY